MRRPDPLVLGAGVLFLVVVGLGVLDASAPEQAFFSRSGSVYDAQPGGASVLREYLSRSGVRTSTIEGGTFAVGSSAAVVFVLGATSEISAPEAAVLRRHAERGGTVVVATDLGVSERALLAAFDVRLGDGGVSGRATPVGPWFVSPPASAVAIDRGVTVALPGDGDALLTMGDGVVGALVPAGRGALVLIGSLGPFLNATIGDAQNGLFALALARMGDGVAFDEYHHGVRPAPDALALAFATWPGRALVAMGIIAFLYIALTGRRLGPAIPLDARPPRSSLEYVRAFAGLVRRSGHGEIARQRLRADLRRGLARVTGLDPGLPLERLVGGLEPARAAEVRALDAVLAAPLRDAELLRTVARIDAVLRVGSTR